MNPSGRPRGAAGLAKYIAEQTDDGQELVDRLLTIARDERGPLRERVASIFALLDRLAGKPMQPSEIAVAVSRDESVPVLPVGWSEMNGPERLRWLDAERVRRALPAGGDQ